MEDLEDDPLQMIEDLILYDLIFSRNDLANIGSNFQLLNMLNRLEKEEDSFWIHLLDYWILSAPIVFL